MTQDFYAKTELLTCRIRHSTQLPTGKGWVMDVSG